jgi:hypothetical protein
MKAITATGFWSGIFAFSATVAYCIVQLLQIAGLLSYPADEILIYGTSLLIVIPLLVEILALHHTTSGSRKFWTHAALIFATLYATFVVANYVVQLATVIPKNLEGRSEEVSLLQQSPHSMFWNFDAIGYIFMGFACLAMVPVFSKSRLGKWVRISLIAHAAVTPLIAFVYFYPEFSSQLLLLGLPWAITAPFFMLMLALWLRAAGKTQQEITGEAIRHSYKSHNSVFIRPFLVWLAFIPIAFVNGAIRETVYLPFTGDLVAHQISTGIAAICFLLLTWFLLRNTVHDMNTRTLFSVGIMWVMLTVVFEFLLGLLSGASWQKMLHDYDLSSGRIWPLFLMIVLLAPFLVKSAWNNTNTRYQYNK